MVQFAERQADAESVRHIIIYLSKLLLFSSLKNDQLSKVTRISSGGFTSRMGRELLRTYPLQRLLGRATEKDKRREVRAPSFIQFKMRYYILLLTILFSNLAFSQSLHIFKGPTNNEGTMVVLLQDYGSNAYYYPVTCTDYYSDMKENAENGWKDFMREEKPYASYLQKTGNNIYTGKLRERIIWNLKLTYNEYEKTAKVVLSHPDYQSNTFELSEVGLDGYKLAKQKHNAADGSRKKSGTSCGACNGSGSIYGFNGVMMAYSTCSWCNGTGYSQIDYGNFNSGSSGNIGGNANTNTNTNTRNGKSKTTTNNSKANCPYCSGKGTRVVNQRPSMMGQKDYSVHCNVCGGTFMFSSGHGHVSCGQCGGTGKMR